MFDINSDLGEGFGTWRVADDAALLDLVTSANVACGFHAGDAVQMGRVVAQAKARGVAIGAHVGLRDLMGFGRVRMNPPLATLRDWALYQIGALDGVARGAGYRISHVNAHGAWTKGRSDTEEAAEMLARLIHDFDPDLVIGVNPVSPLFRAARRAGLRVAGKIYADRAYDGDGTLTARSQPGALVTDLAQVAQRVREFVQDGTVRTLAGPRIKVEAKVFVIHSDTPGAVEITRTVRETLEEIGAPLAPLDQIAA